MKKQITIIGILFLVLILNGCSSSTDNTLQDQVVGKWQYTSFFTDVATDENGNPIDTTILNGYIVDLKSNGTFTSNELSEYSGGTYTVINNPGKNIKLVYKNSSGSFIGYKYLILVNEDKMTVSFQMQTPVSDSDAEGGFYAGEYLTRLP